MSFLIPPTPWLPFGPPPSDAAICLITFHHAGGSAAFFRSWIQSPLLKGITVCPVELPGHGQRYEQPCAEDLESLLQPLSAVVGSIAQRVPRTLLFGHSLGSLLAYEIAYHLHDQGIELSTLIASARRPPQLTTQKPWVHEMPDTLLLKTLQKLGGIPEDVLAHEEFMKWFLPIIRADFAITERYVPSHPIVRLPIPVVTFRGKDDQEVSHQEMSQWTHIAGGIYHEHTYSGGHFYLNTPSVLTSVLREIACIAGSSVSKLMLKH